MVSLKRYYAKFFFYHKGHRFQNGSIIDLELRIGFLTLDFKRLESGVELDGSGTDHSRFYLGTGSFDVLDRNQNFRIKKLHLSSTRIFVS